MEVPAMQVRYYTLSEAARIVGMSYNGIRDLVRRGVLKMELVPPEQLSPKRGRHRASDAIAADQLAVFARTRGITIKQH